jgi:hypothetical protein
MPSENPVGVKVVWGPLPALSVQIDKRIPVDCPPILGGPTALPGSRPSLPGNRSHV